MVTKNRLSKLVALTEKLPLAVRHRVLNRILGRVVPMVGTAHIQYLTVHADQVVVRLDNHRAMQNHIKGIHAAAMALLAETASGFVTALNVPDHRLVLIKSLKVEYQRIAQGALTATATLDPRQQQFIADNEKGELSIPVSIVDESGNSPIRCEMIWAWRPKSKKTH